MGDDDLKEHLMTYHSPGLHPFIALILLSSAVDGE
jgi:hypothetical protein